MTTTMQSSSNSLKSLKGVFDVPKMNHRRDFLRENKLNLRELQKTTTHKLTQQKQEIEKKQQKHIQRFVAKRSDSQQAQQTAADNAYQSGKNVGAFRRSYSLHRENMQPNHASSHMVNSYDTYAANYQCEDVKNNLRVPPPRSASLASMISKAESCDKEIQTEDIIDEDFLYEALKKCNSTEADFGKKHIRDEMPNEPNLSKSHGSLQNQHSKYNEHQTAVRSREHISYDYQDHDIPDERKSHDQLSQYTSRSQYSQMHNGHNQIMATHDDRNEREERLEEHFQNLQIESQRHQDHEQLSGRSRQTMCSNVSKKKINGNYKLGAREDLRLPRYLEKEKREKEDQRQRSMLRDPNCPLGHYALPEEDRLTALNCAQKKMDSLVNELNRMPMTTETLRIRKRKVEIEKELSQIELDIRTFSKPKVYVSTEPPMQY